MKKVALITSGYMPVPNTLGGAVESLDTMLLEQNESTPKVNFTVFSASNEEAKRISKSFKCSTFHFIDTPFVLNGLDIVIYSAAKFILHKKKLMSYRYILQRLWYIHKVALLLKEYDFDAVIIENHATLFMVLKKYKNSKKYASKVYYHLHNEITNDFGCKEEILSSKKVLGVSQFIINQFEKQIGTLSARQKSVWKNCVDTDIFNPNNAETIKEGKQWRKNLHISDDEIVFLFSGRLSEEKGAKELLSAFIETNKIITKSRLVVAGSFFYDSSVHSSFEEELHHLAGQLKGKIAFTGYIDYDQMPGIYAMSDICCLPSIWEDPAPLTVIESLASGKPLITTNSGGIPEYAVDGGGIVLERDANLEEALMQSMIRLANSPALRKKMASSARAYAENLSKYFYLQQLTDFI